MFCNIPENLPEQGCTQGPRSINCCHLCFARLFLLNGLFLLVLEQADTRKNKVLPQIPFHIKDKRANMLSLHAL